MKKSGKSLFIENDDPNGPQHMAPIVGHEAPALHKVKLPELQPELVFTLKTHFERCRKQLAEIGVDNLETYSVKTVLTNTLVKCIEVYATSCDLIDYPWDVIQESLIQTYADINKVKMEYSRLIDRLNFSFADGLVFCNKVRQMHRMAKCVDLTSKEFLKDVCTKLPRSILVKLIDDTRKKSKDGDWTSVAVEDVLDALAEIIMSNNAVEALVPFSPATKRARFEPRRDSVMRMHDRTPNVRDFASQYQFAIYIADRQELDPQWGIQPIASKSYTNKLGSDYVIAAFSCKEDMIAAEKVLVSRNAKFRIWNYGMKSKN